MTLDVGCTQTEERQYGVHSRRRIVADRGATGGFPRRGGQVGQEPGAVRRLALVLYHEEARRKQQMILFEARHKLPAGVIRLVSIEAMESGDWDWEELTTPR